MEAETTLRFTDDDSDIDLVRHEGRTHGQGPLCRFAFELQRRRVCRTVLSYSLLVWLNVQIGDVFFPMAGLPDWSLRLVVVVGFLGLPLVIFLAWTFQITPRGVRVDSSLRSMKIREDFAPQASGTEMLINVTLLVLGAAIAGWLVTERALAESRWSDGTTSDGELGPPQELLVAISFHSTGDQLVTTETAQGLEAQVRHQLIQLPNVTVVSDMASGSTVTDGADKLRVSGIFRLHEGQVQVLVDALDLTSNRYVWTEKFDLPCESMHEAEQAAADRIVEEVRRALPDKEMIDPLIRQSTLELGQQLM